jgi:small subunit ribosomal protein S5
MPEETPKSSEQLQQENPQQAVQHSAPETGDPAAVAGAQTGAPEVAPAAPHPASGRGGERGGQRGGGRGDGRGRGGPRRDRRDREGEEGGIESAVVRIYRCSKVVKGGRTFSFGALVVAGDRKGNVGIGYGKANEVPPAVEKATKDARKAMIKVNLKGSTIPHTVKGTSGASTVVLAPARPGTGVTAGKSVRPCLELSGITDILTKAYGSTSPKNLVKATIAALKQLQNRDQVEKSRGVQLAKGAGELVTA